jgi:hypothetical protein
MGKDGHNFLLQNYSSQRNVSLQYGCHMRNYNKCILKYEIEVKFTPQFSYAIYNFSLIFSSKKCIPQLL